MAARQISLAARLRRLAVGPLGAWAGVVGLAGLMLLSACGQKGPLTLPKAPAAASAPAASAPR
jgi:hypothetical protein